MLPGRASSGLSRDYREHMGFASRPGGSDGGGPGAAGRRAGGSRVTTASSRRRRSTGSMTGVTDCRRTSRCAIRSWRHIETTLWRRWMLSKSLRSPPACAGCTMYRPPSSKGLPRRDCTLPRSKPSCATCQPTGASMSCWLPAPVSASLWWKRFSPLSPNLANGMWLESQGNHEYRLNQKGLGAFLPNLFWFSSVFMPLRTLCAAR